MTSSHDADHEHGEIHLPPNSWVPISLSMALSMMFIGFLMTPAVWIVGLVWVLLTLAAWYRGARSEYLELPE